jgi:hypothetical protein
MLFPLTAIDEFWKQMVPDWIATLPTSNPTVLRLNELAVKLDGTVLPEIGVKGNSHMLMQDGNSLTVAQYLWDWVDKQVRQSK